MIASTLRNQWTELAFVATILVGEFSPASLKHAIAVSTPDPMYPKSASQNKIGGDTIVTMTVLTDGSVTDIQVIGSSARSLDEASLNTLTRWKFKPAICGAEPVVSDIHVVVSFRME